MSETNIIVLCIIIYRELEIWKYLQNRINYLYYIFKSILINDDSELNG